MNSRQSYGGEPVTLMLLGSGLRFPAFIGALSAIEEKGINIGRIVGASAGSIIGSLYASGKEPIEMRKVVMELDTTMFRDFGLVSLFSGKGLYKGAAAEEFIDDLLDGRSFKEFYKPTYVVATDIKSNTPFVFSRLNFPDMKVSRAIRYSIGIPLVFSYRRLEHDGRERVLVDGNLLSGSVADMFNDSRMLILKVVSGRTHVDPAASFGLASYVKRLVQIMMSAVERERIAGKFWQDTIIIPCGDIPPTKFAISADEKRFLIDQGYNEARRYLEYKWGV